MPLKSGSVADFASSLAEAMENEMKTEWQAVKHTALPDQGVEDRRLLFVAIARGTFNFLKQHESDFMKKITLHDASGIGGDIIKYAVVQLELNL
jgi:hypothetical protein